MHKVISGMLTLLFRQIMKNIFFIIGVLFYAHCAAQIRFSKQYISDSTNWLSSIRSVNQLNDTVYLALIGIYKSSNEESLLIVKVDQNGNLVWKKDYHLRESITPVEITPTKDNNFIISGGRTIINNGLRTLLPFLFKINQQGDSIWYKEYTSEKEWSIASFLTETSDGGFVTCGYTVKWLKSGTDYKEQPWQAYVIRTDSLGNLLWKYEYGDFSHSEVAQCVVELPNQDLIVVGRSLSHVKGENFDIDLLTIRIDKDGQGKWFKKYGQLGLNESFTKITSSRGSLYLVSGGFSSPAPNANHGGILAKMDENGNMQWLKKLNSEVEGLDFSGGHVELANGDITVTGVNYKDYDVGIAQFDSTGAFKWLRRHDLNPNSDESIYGIIHTLDNGFAIFGHGLSPIRKNDQAWLLKLDQYGCDTEVCAKSVATSDMPVSEVGQLIAYPNPSNGLARVRWDIDEGLAHAVLSISDMSGVLVKSVQIMTATGEYDLGDLDLADGMYIATIKSVGRCLASKFVILR
jgi:hypothetical protein